MILKKEVAGIPWFLLKEKAVGRFCMITQVSSAINKTDLVGIRQIILNEIAERNAKNHPEKYFDIISSIFLHFINNFLTGLH